ncbi:hypothetical protein ABAC460_12820 [Asticcacaulis sp. AC460]|uniref:TIM-barrel domain-containing protein n=1 Tax=Asticcacaulis sp. AC460 TaxID=1282360 RepID=UPI0003C3F1A2|nr:TIM-barrel domain-containing protein [Asticcacaulis sp. AC460]ESQ89387.1 hypothetical protein ABAC460_12820 [Asticcacaulis sp. AC460]
MTRQSLTRRAILAAGAAAGAAMPAGAATPVDSVSDIPGGVRLSRAGLTTDILFMPGGAVGVVKYPADPKLDIRGFFQGNGFANDIRRDGDRLSSGDIEVRIDRTTGALVFSRGGRLIIADDAASTPSLQQFSLAKTHDLYGLGQFRDPLTNYRDKKLYIAHGNMDAVNPVLVSPDGFGLLWDTGTDSHFESRGKHLNYSNPSPVTRYYLFLGDNTDAVIRQYRLLTGTAPLLPKYAYGFWQSQERYRTQAELIGILDGYRSRNLPVDVMVQDWRYWGEDGQFSGMVWDKVNFADPKAMCAEVHAKNAHIIASVWPAMGPDSAVHKALAAENLLFQGAHWSGGKVLDITAPKARDIYWKHIKSGLIDVGLDGLWTDGTEPEFMSTGSRYVTTRSYISNGDSFAGPLKDRALTFSYQQARLLYSGMRDARPDKRPLILTRSVYAGQQAFNTVTWSGDIFAGWETLNFQITAAQQISLSGIPYWTNDIGGFLVSHRFPGGLDNPAYRELYVRWFQFAAFLPVFRAHGTEIRRELWAMGNDGEPHYEALKTALNLRYALMPYIYNQAHRVTQQHESFLRPLVMDFPGDPKIKDYPSQYMFGHDILVCPVMTPLDHTQVDPYEFLPNYAVTGLDSPAPRIEFFEGANFETLVDIRHSDDLKMSWSGDIPFALKGKPYSAVWKGRIIAQETGRHKFQVMTQGLIRFTLGGQVRVASQGTGAGATAGANGAVSFAGHNGDDVYRFEMELKAGQAYDFELTQSQPKPDVVSLWVEWITPSHAKDMQATPDKTIAVYLPAGHDWYPLLGGPSLKGGQVLKLRPKLDEIPVFVLAGAIIPMSRGIQYATQKPDTIELHVYRGADVELILSDDSGEGSDYQYQRTLRWTMSWDDGTQTFSIDADHRLNLRHSQAFELVVHGKDGGFSRHAFTLNERTSFVVETTHAAT